MAWVHDRLEYVPGVTGVQTSASEAARAGRGVCQDFAHLSLALLRATGVPARYVSGYLHPQSDARDRGPCLGGEPRVDRRLVRSLVGIRSYERDRRRGPSCDGRPREGLLRRPPGQRRLRRRCRQLHVCRGRHREDGLIFRRTTSGHAIGSLLRVWRQRPSAAVRLHWRNSVLGGRPLR